MRPPEEIDATEMPKEWSGIIPTETFINEAKRIANEGKKQGITLRIMGGVAIRIHSIDFEDFARKLGRLGEPAEQEFTDIDFMAYRKQRKSMPDFFKVFGYSKRKTTLSSAASERQIYFHPKGWFYIDVFYDALKMNHDINFRGRLELDSPTITPTDLLLEKLQIVQFSEKDLKDTLVLLRAHEAGETEKETINAKHIAKLLAVDWGFWYTVTNNLSGIREIASKHKALTNTHRKDIISKIDTIRNYIDNEPKSLSWKSRAILGSKKKWYRPVETTDSVAGFGIWRMRKIFRE